MVILTGDIAKCRMRWMKNLSAGGLGWMGRVCLEWTRDNDDASIASRVSFSCDNSYYRHIQVTVVYKSYKHADLVLHSQPVYWEMRTSRQVDTKNNRSSISNHLSPVPVQTGRLPLMPCHHVAQSYRPRAYQYLEHYYRRTKARTYRSEKSFHKTENKSP